MRDYRRINATHRLSSYQVKVPHWTGDRDLRPPFLAWSDNQILPWYETYNTAKHDRQAGFAEATFDSLLDACCGVLVLLSAQFYTHSFSPGPDYLIFESANDGMESAIGGYFRVKFPDDWPHDEQYQFDWQKLQLEPEPFQTIDYNSIK